MSNLINPIRNSFNDWRNTKETVDLDDLSNRLLLQFREKLYGGDIEIGSIRDFRYVADIIIKLKGLQATGTDILLDEPIEISEELEQELYDELYRQANDHNDDINSNR